VQLEDLFEFAIHRARTIGGDISIRAHDIHRS
jgi:hypothetical protein